MSKELDMTCLRNWKMNMWKYLHKRALWKRLYSAKETYNFKEPTNRSHPRWTCESISTTEPYISTKEPDISTKRALHLHKRALHLHQRASHLHKRALICGPAQESHTSTKMPHISAKESHISTKEPYISRKEPHICAKQPYIYFARTNSPLRQSDSRPLFCRKIPAEEAWISAKDSHTFAKEAWISAEDSHTFAKDPCFSWKKKATHESTTNSRFLFCGKTGAEKHQQKRHTSSPKSPICLQKMPV